MFHILYHIIFLIFHDGSNSYDFEEYFCFWIFFHRVYNPEVHLAYACFLCVFSSYAEITEYYSALYIQCNFTFIADTLLQMRHMWPVPSSSLAIKLSISETRWKMFKDIFHVHQFESVYHLITERFLTAELILNWRWEWEGGWLVPTLG